MAPIYSGSLQPKKKIELLEIALALGISDQGTKEELVQRITKYLDFNQSSLEDNPTFTGLFSRRKRSVQPQPIPSTRLALSSTSEASGKPRSSIRRPIALDPIKESIPTKYLRDASTSLGHPLSLANSPSHQTPRHVDVIKSHIPPSLPQSPSKSLMERLPKAPEVKAIVQQFRQQDILQNGNELLTSLRLFLSNSRNIWSVSALLELVFILWTIIPWKKVEISLMSNVPLTINYPPLQVFKTSVFWLVLLHWALPTVIIPASIGCMITFNPALLKRNHLNKMPVAPIDPLTASIIRLVGHIVYPYASIASKSDIVGLDVLGSNWRILDAAMGLAFAFAEAIAAAPQVLADTIVKEERRLVQRSHTDNVDSEDVVLPGRRAIAAAEEESSGEVD